MPCTEFRTSRGSLPGSVPHNRRSSAGSLANPLKLARSRGSFRTLAPLRLVAALGKAPSCAEQTNAPYPKLTNILIEGISAVKSCLVANREPREPGQASTPILNFFPCRVIAIGTGCMQFHRISGQPLGSKGLLIVLLLSPEAPFTTGSLRTDDGSAD